VLHVLAVQLLLVLPAQALLGYWSAVWTAPVEGSSGGLQWHPIVFTGTTLLMDAVRNPLYALLGGACLLTGGCLCIRTGATGLTAAMA